MAEQPPSLDELINRVFAGSPPFIEIVINPLATKAFISVDQELQRELQAELRRAEIPTEGSFGGEMVTKQLVSFSLGSVAAFITTWAGWQKLGDVLIALLNRKNHDRVVLRITGSDLELIIEGRPASNLDVSQIFELMQRGHQQQLERQRLEPLSPCPESCGETIADG
jgi:hypothetical protein